MFIHSRAPIEVTELNPGWSTGLPNHIIYEWDLTAVWATRALDVTKAQLTAGRITDNSLVLTNRLLELVHIAETDYRKHEKIPDNVPTNHEVVVRTGAANELLFRNTIVQSIVEEFFVNPATGRSDSR